jgi:hypothetical protein
LIRTGKHCIRPVPRCSILNHHRKPPGHGGPGGPGGPPVDQPPPEGPPEESAPAKPAWRTVTQRAPRKQKKKNPDAPPAAAAGPGPALHPPTLDPRAQVTSWATWQRRLFCTYYLFLDSSCFTSRPQHGPHSHIRRTYSPRSWRQPWTVWTKVTARLIPQIMMPFTHVLQFCLDNVTTFTTVLNLHFLICSMHLPVMPVHHALPVNF